MFRTLLLIVSSRLLWGAMGITALCLLIWTIGPLIAIGDMRPLESEENRFIAIALFWLLWFAFRLVPRLWRRLQNRRLVRRLETPAPVEAPPETRVEETQLAARFNEATQLLRHARFNRAENRRLPAWLQRFNRQYLYQLPWYMLIGAPGAGKTTALINSGLHFPLADRFGKNALRGVGGTRNCDWWFTDEAILLDTAGRYTTQESDREQDASEWKSFMSLLKRSRPRQPINGAIVTISIGDLLTEDETARHAQASALRQRLLELREQLGIPFPVYLLVTKSDLLKGFAPTFAGFSKAQRDQVWGVTWPWRQKQPDLGAEFDYQFERLHSRLLAGVSDLMIAEHNSARRAEIYLFPQEFAALKPLLRHYLEILFASSHYEETLRPRGIYFTSGTQEGLPFDRVMGQMNRALGLPDIDARAAAASQDDFSHATPVPAGHGQSFFLQQVLQSVIFKEAGLAGVNRWWEYRNRMAHWIGYGLFGSVLLIALLWWLTSYHHNKNYLAATLAKIPAFERQGAALPPLNSADMFALLPYLRSLTAIPRSPQLADPNSPPVGWRAGLYRGEEVNSAAASLYDRALQELLLPLAARNITDWLRNDNGSDVDYSYEALKAYQMLYMPQHYDGQFLHAWIMLNIQRFQGANAPQEALHELDQHLGRLFDNKINTSPFERDDALVVRQQNLINRSPLASRVYGRLKRLLAAQGDKGVSLLTLGGPQSELVFSRKSGAPLTQPIPSLFTPQGYWGAFSDHIGKVASGLQQEDKWVLSRRESDSGQQRLEDSVRRLYMEDFIAHWDALLSDIQLNPASSLEARINMARLLSGRTSPLRQLRINLSRYLTLAKPEKDEKPSLAERGAHYFNNNATQTLQALFRARKAEQRGSLDAPEQRVMAHYDAIIEQAQATDGQRDHIPFDEQLKNVDDLYGYLTAVQDASNSMMAPPRNEIISRMQADAGREPEPFRSMLLSLAVGASSDTQQRSLNNTQKRASVEVGSFCRQAIAGRYPLSSRSGVDITPDDMARMFAPGSGLMDSFFRASLASNVDTTQSRWRFAPGVDGKSLPGGAALLEPFQQAQAIRDALFASGASAPSYRLTIRPLSMDNAILNLTLDVDGQLIRYSHGPQTPQVVSWPGPGGTQQVRMQSGLTDGSGDTLTTSGAWALNRLFDKARIANGGSPLSHIATFSLGGRQVVLEYTANSVRNPLQLPAFRCP